jgi:hypothetical protein
MSASSFFYDTERVGLSRWGDGGEARSVMTLCGTLLLAAWGAALPAPVCAQEAWSETQIQAPAVFSTDKLITVPQSGPSELVVGIDPNSLSVGADEVVRYVLVARSASGALNVSFEGIHCKSARTRVLARWNTVAQQWRVSDTSEWKNIHDERGSRYAKTLARTGVCDGPTPNTPLSHMTHALKMGRMSHNEH